MSTFTSLHFHIIFSTKYRKPWIHDTWMERLHEYIGEDSRARRRASICWWRRRSAPTCSSDEGNSSTLRFHAELKKSTSEWVHETIKESGFLWQEGYAAFTVGATSRDGVRGYIANQREHHRKKTFQEELIELLELAGVEYDPKYLD